MMRTTTVNFDVVRATADYTCACDDCGKPLKRKATAEHTINPFNTNEDGSVKTRSEVYASALSEARASADVLKDGAAVCRDCEDAPNRALLLEMAAEPKKVFPQPERYWNSPMHILADRKHVEAVYERCECGAACCSGYVNKNGYRITRAGLARATTLQAKPQEQAA